MASAIMNERRAKIKHVCALIPDHPIQFGDTLYAMSLQNDWPKKVYYEKRGSVPGRFTLRPAGKTSGYEHTVMRPIHSTHELMQNLADEQSEALKLIATTPQEARDAYKQLFADIITGSTDAFDASDLN